MLLAHAHLVYLVTLMAAASSPTTQEAQSQPASEGLFLRASALDSKRLLDPKASLADRDFAAKALRFAVTATQTDFEVISAQIERAFSEAMESGKSTLSFAVIEAYNERAAYYFQIHKETKEKREIRESLDSGVRSVFYRGNQWFRWASVASVFVDPPKNNPILDPAAAERYSKIAIAMNPREPYSYAPLVQSYFLRQQYEEADRIASRCLEVAKFEHATFAGWSGDNGRAWFNDYKGRCHLKMGHLDRARDYLQTALSLGRSEEAVQPFLGEALALLAQNSKPLKLGESKQIGYKGKEDKDRHAVVSVTENSPAGVAGLQVGDVIVKVDGLPALDGNKRSRLVPARDAILAGTREKVLLEVHRGDQVLYFVMSK